VSTFPFTNLPSEGETQDSDPQLSSDQPVPPDDLSGVVLELEISEPPSDLHLPGNQGDKEAVGREEGDHEKPPLPMSEPPLDLAPLPTSEPSPHVHLPRDQTEMGVEEEGEQEKHSNPPLPMSEPPLDLAPLPTSGPPPDVHLPRDQTEMGVEEEGEQEKQSNPPLPMSEPPLDLAPLPTSGPPPDMYLPRDQIDAGAEEEEEDENPPIPPLPTSEHPPNLFEVESHPPLPMSEPPADLFKVISSPPFPTSEPPPDPHLPEQDNGEMRAEEEEGEHEKQHSPLPPTNLPEETKGGQLPSQRKHGHPTLSPIKLPSTSQIVADQRPSSPLGEVMYKVMSNTMYL